MTQGQLTLPPLDKMATISQKTFSNTFSWIKSFVFWFEFHWSLFLRVQLTIFQHCFRLWLGADQATSHYLNQCWPSSLTLICGARGTWVNHHMIKLPHYNELCPRDIGKIDLNLPTTEHNKAQFVYIILGIGCSHGIVPLTTRWQSLCLECYSWFRDNIKYGIQLQNLPRPGVGVT